MKGICNRKIPIYLPECDFMIWEERTKLQFNFDFINISDITEFQTECVTRFSPKFFSWFEPIQTPYKQVKVFLNAVSISPKYSNFKKAPHVHSTAKSSSPVWCTPHVKWSNFFYFFCLTPFSFDAHHSFIGSVVSATLATGLWLCPHCLQLRFD